MKTETTVSTSTLTDAPVLIPEKPSSPAPFPRIVTTSWDDGDPLDLRVAKMLGWRRLSGTFYLPVKGHHKGTRMSLAEMLDLDRQGFEIGAHGISHPNLPQCNPHQLVVEVESCKKRLEDDLAKEVLMFAYPRGRHNRHVINALKNAGYGGARTTAMLAYGLEFDAFRMPTSIQVYPHSRLDYFRNLPRAWKGGRAWVYATHFRRANNWIELAKLLFDSMYQNGGIWHLYGHSWEIDELGLWKGLASVLDYVAGRPGVSYVSNGAAVPMRAHRRPIAS